MSEDPAVLKFKELAAKFMANAPPEEKDDIPDDFPPEDTRGYRLQKPAEKVERSPSRSRSRSRSPRGEKRRERRDYSSDSDSSGPELVTSQTYGRKIEKKSTSSGRSGGSRGGFGSSRAQSRSKVIRVPNEKVSMIIGKGGSQIKDIQSSTGAQVKIADPTQGPDREITVIGHEDQQQKAIDMINSIISQQRGGRSDRGGGYGGRNDFKFEMQIPNDRVGLVIGKQGATINEIKQQSGAQVSVQRDASNGSTTPLTIQAKSQESLDHARQLVEERINSNRDSGRGRGGSRFDYNQGSRYPSYEQQDPRYSSYDDRNQQGGGYYQQQQQPQQQSSQFPQGGGEVIGDWTSYIDPNSGYTYWVNLKTGKTSWDRPSQ